MERKKRRAMNCQKIMECGLVAIFIWLALSIFFTFILIFLVSLVEPSTKPDVICLIILIFPGAWIGLIASGYVLTTIDALLNSIINDSSFKEEFKKAINEVGLVDDGDF
ncbi:MAG: hypothetical protein HFJ17_01810 [Clostridia bacterium]|nr:hypothetical protein [Clostridia bacterium]